MEREQDRWKRIYRQVSVAAGIDHNTHHTYCDCLIVGVLLWSALNDRPVSWACARCHWPGPIRPPALASQTCMSRRLRTASVAAVLQRSYGQLRDQLPSGMLKFIDAKPLPVGGCSKDADALYGRAASCKAKGYKLFVLQDAAAGVADAWLLGPMNWSEQRAADVLLPRLDGPALVIGDGEYDVSRLHDLAAAQDSALLTPAPAKAQSTGHHYLSPHRENGLALARSSVGAVLLMSRIGIEQGFGHLTSFAGGLGPLPAWVRRPHRVVVWVAAKLLINLDRQIQLRTQREQLPNAA
jgi:hypothetical protein